jgi:hypothetical protein
LGINQLWSPFIDFQPKENGFKHAIINFILIVGLTIQQFFLLSLAVLGCRRLLQRQMMWLVTDFIYWF